jgi:trimeric autotransporter adhesin
MRSLLKCLLIAVLLSGIHGYSSAQTQREVMGWSAEFVSGTESRAVTRLRAGRVNAYGAELQTAMSPFGSGRVHALLAEGGNLYVGGIFESIGGIVASGIARYHLSTASWSSLGSGVLRQQGFLGSYGWVTTLALRGDMVFVGGDFETAGGGPSENIAAYETGAGRWSSLGSGTDSDVDVLLTVGDDLYVGGWFREAGGQEAGYVARYNTVSRAWSTLAEGVDELVIALEHHDGKLFAGGAFEMAGTSPAKSLAVYDIAAGTWSAVGSGTNGLVTSLAIHDRYLYVGGLFSVAGGVPAAGLARYDLGTGEWSAVGSGVSGFSNENGGVWALRHVGDQLFVGGRFTHAGGTPASSIARFDLSGGTWHALGSGLILGGTAFSMEVVGNDLYVGGEFLQAGGISSHNIARYTMTTGVWTSLAQAGSVSAREDLAAAPTTVLGAAYPNPVFDVATLPLTLERPEEVRLEIYNVLGQKMATLLDGYLPAGTHDIRIDARDLVPGVYIVTLRSGRNSTSSRAAIIR